MPTEAAKSVLLSGSHILKSVKDDAFFGRFPEFAVIKAKLNAMHANLNPKTGCSSCQQRRIQYSIDADYARIAADLPADRAKALKSYFGLADGQKFFIHAVDPRTRSVYLKEL